MSDTPVVYLVFDLLFFDGHSTMALPYTERRRLLESLDLSGQSWQTPAYHTGDGAALLEASRSQGLEGVMAKRLDSPYEAGRRSASWLKVKNKLTQEVVIGGWLPGDGARSTSFGALLVGVYDIPGSEAERTGQPQQLLYAGRVGSGFTGESLDGLVKTLAGLRRDAPPFASPPRESTATYVEPRIVAVVEFTEWTRDGVLRHPVFKGLRSDADPGEVIREEIVRDL